MSKVVPNDILHLMSIVNITRCKKKCTTQMSTVNPLNGRLVKADTSLKRTGVVGPCHSSVIHFMSLQGGHVSKTDSRSWSRACPP